MHALSAPFTRTYEALKIIMRQEMEYKTKFTGGIYGIQTKVWRNTMEVRTIPLRIFTTAHARQQVTPPHLDVLFMATATIVVEANEAVSGPLSVQFLTKRKVSFFLPPLPPFLPSMLLSFFLSGHYYFHLCTIGIERGGGTQSLNQGNGHNGDGRGEGVC